MTPTKSSARSPKSSEETATTIRSLSDHELRAALKENGLSPGPITDSTRELYRKKLLSILEDIKEESSNDQGDDSDKTESSDESFHVDEEELNESSDSYSEEVDESDEEEEELDDEESAEDSSTNKSSPRNKIVPVIIAIIIIAVSCYLYANNNLKAYKNLTRQLLILLALSPIGYIAYRVYRFYLTKRNEENKHVCKLVSEALELLQSPEHPKGLLPILHIRDTLLTPAERKTKKITKIWQKAVKFIEEHESRIKVEMVNIDGEDFRAWKWIGSRKLI